MTRLRPWLLLARRLTSSAPTWGVWKRPNSALEGEGDIDAVASEEDWGTVVDEYRLWASEQAFDPVLVCRHVPGLLILVAWRTNSRAASYRWMSTPTWSSEVLAC